MRVQIEIDSDLIQAVSIGTINLVLAQGTKVRVLTGGDDPDKGIWKEVNPQVMTRHLKLNEVRQPVMPRPLQAKAIKNAREAAKLVQIK